MTVKRLDSVIQGRNLLLEAQGNEQVKKEKLLPAYERFIEEMKAFSGLLQSRKEYKYDYKNHVFRDHKTNIISENDDAKAQRDYVLARIQTLATDLFPEDETKANNLRDFLFFKSFGNKNSKGPNIFYDRMLDEKSFPSADKFVEKGFWDTRRKDERDYLINTQKYVEKLRDKGLNPTEKATPGDVRYKRKFLQTKKSRIEREAEALKDNMKGEVDLKDIAEARKKAFESLKEIPDNSPGIIGLKNDFKERLESKNVLEISIPNDEKIKKMNLPEASRNFVKALRDLYNKISQYKENLFDRADMEKYEARIAKIDRKINDLFKPAKGEEPQVDMKPAKGEDPQFDSANNGKVEPKETSSEKTDPSQTPKTPTPKSPTSKTETNEPTKTDQTESPKIPTPKSPTSKTETPKKRTFSTELKAFFSALIRKIKALVTACFKSRKPKTVKA